MLRFLQLDNFRPVHCEIGEMGCNHLVVAHAGNELFTIIDPPRYYRVGIHNPLQLCRLKSRGAMDGPGDGYPRSIAGSVAEVPDKEENGNANCSRRRKENNSPVFSEKAPSSSYPFPHVRHYSLAPVPHPAKQLPFSLSENPVKDSRYLSHV